MSEVKSVEFILENCEALEFEARHIDSMVFEGFNRKIGRVAMNSIRSTEAVDHVSIRVLAEANHADQFTVCFDEEDTSPFKRVMQYSDITSFVINYEDDSEEQLHVDWCESDEYVNRFQSNEIASNGDLLVVVSRKKSVDTEFDVLLNT